MSDETRKTYVIIYNDDSDFLEVWRSTPEAEIACLIKDGVAADSIRLLETKQIPFTVSYGEVTVTLDAEVQK